MFDVDYVDRENIVGDNLKNELEKCNVLTTRRSRAPGEIFYIKMSIKKYLPIVFAYYC